MIARQCATKIQQNAACNDHLIAKVVKTRFTTKKNERTKKGKNGKKRGKKRCKNSGVKNFFFFVVFFFCFILQNNFKMVFSIAVVVVFVVYQLYNNNKKFKVIAIVTATAPLPAV